MKQNSKVAFITGAARRIGAEIATVLHAAGINVVLHYHTSQAEAETLCAQLNAKRPQSAVAVQADLQEIDNLPSLIATVMNAWERLDILVNNASQFYSTDIGVTTELAWDELLTTNLKAPFFLAQAAAPELTKNHGSIINIADIHGERPMRHFAVYSISKAGLIMMTKALARELGPNIRVNAVSPGPTLWPEGKNTLADATKKEILSRTVLPHPEDAQEIAQAVLFLATQANYVTGQVLAVDGGRLLFA